MNKNGPSDMTLCSRKISSVSRSTTAAGISAAQPDPVIRRTVKFSEATVAGEPLTEYATASAGADAYRQLAKEVLVRCLDA